MKKILLLLLVLQFTIIVSAQKSLIIDNCSIFLPKTSSGIAILCCPGGGYITVCDEHEGKGWAPFFNEQNITWVVLNYDLPKGNPDIPFASVGKAMELIKNHAKEWNIDTTKIGIAGFSAGGHLAATYAVKATKNKPAFQLLFYPVITMDTTYTHIGSHDNLLGENATQKQNIAYSLEKQVTAKTPKALVFVSTDDNVVPPANSKNYVTALQNIGIDATLVTFPLGNHGWGCSEDFAFHKEILNKISKWLIQFRN